MPAARQRRQPVRNLSHGHRLRPWSTADAPILPIAMRDPLIRRYASVLTDDRDAALLAIHTWTDQWGQGTGAAWAIADPGGQVVGQIRFGLLDPQLSIGAVGYWLLPEARGSGLVTQGLNQATADVFHRLGWHRIELQHAMENTRSCVVARRSGYLAEGVLRQAMFYPSDRRRSDEHLHARLAEDTVRPTAAVPRRRDQTDLASTAEFPGQ